MLPVRRDWRPAVALEKGTTDFVATCDFCSEFLETEETNFHDAVAEIKKHGWAVFKENGEWNHMCPSCRDDESRDRAKRKFSGMP